MTQKLNLEEKGDYSLEFMDQISNAILSLKDYSGSNDGNKLNGIINTINLAKANGLNVEKLEKQILEFRVVLFYKDIESKIDEINIQQNQLSLDISRLEKEYKELLLEKDIDIKLLNKEMNKLKTKIVVENIKFMINDLNDTSSEPNFAKIIDSISDAEKHGINVDEVKEIIYG